MVAETQFLSTGLFVTGILARAISLFGFDSRTIPAPLSLDRDVISFILFVVSPNCWVRYSPSSPRRPPGALARLSTNLALLPL